MQVINSTVGHMGDCAILKNLGPFLHGSEEEAVMASCSLVVQVGKSNAGEKWLLLEALL